MGVVNERLFLTILNVYSTVKDKVWFLLDEFHDSSSHQMYVPGSNGTWFLGHDKILNSVALFFQNWIVALLQILYPIMIPARHNHSRFQRLLSSVHLAPEVNHFSHIKNVYFVRITMACSCSPFYDLRPPQSSEDWHMNRISPSCF